MVVAALSLAAAGCVGDGESDRGPETAAAHDELDVIGLAKTPASLLVLDPTTADVPGLRAHLHALGGGVIAELPPRLVIAQVPAGADAITANLGVVARFDRPVEPGELAGATTDEDRFTAVYANRWFAQIPRAIQLAPRRQPRAKGETFEAQPTRGHVTKGIVGPGGPGPQPDPEDQVSVPYASGTIVVSIVLPESNGSIDPSTEDWNEQSIRETYLKVQAALDTFVAADPNANLRYIVHYESAPADGGLAGTVDTGYEFGQRAQWNDYARESEATAAVLGKILGRTVDANDLYTAALEYDKNLRDRYHADGAFFVIVAANQNYTASLRAHAYINGPWTVLDSSYGYETFAHEFGHIHGAYDEYCPDACSQPVSIQGYLGIYNANATYRTGDVGGGINNGNGENEPSLMQYNDPTNINGYTRASWGWVDLDGDGIVDVRDTLPQSALDVTVAGNTVHVTGRITDQPATRFYGGTKYSVNRITALEYRVGHAPAAPWFRVRLGDDTRGKADLDLALLDLPAGTHELWLRAVNSVGNREVAKRTMVTVAGAINAAPRVRLDLDRATAGASTPVTAQAVAIDGDGDALEFRFDTDGNGLYDTGWSSNATVTFTPARTGLVQVGVQVRDGHGNNVWESAELAVFAGNAPPTVAMSNTPSLLHGATAIDLSATATAADPEGGALEYQWQVDTATSNYPFHSETAWSASPDFSALLETPKSLAGARLDLAAGDATLISGEIRQVVALDSNTLAVAGGTKGVWFVDITNRDKPAVISHVDLETTANRLYRDGNKLWVLGSMLTVVDIRTLTAPREIKQILATTGKQTATAAEVYDIPEGEGSVQEFMYLDSGERISDTRVQVTVDHPRLADLTITLYPPKGKASPITLWDHKNGVGNHRTLTFNTGNTPKLRDLNGLFAAEPWQVVVTDDQANGITGQLLSAELRFQTSSRAVPVIESATQIIGFAGKNILIGGAGLQLLDTSFAQWVLPVGALKGTGTNGAVKLGNRVVWYGPLETKSKTGTIIQPPMRGLVAVDISVPFAPRLVRSVVDLGGNAADFAVVGGRMYVRVQPDKCTGRDCVPDPIFTVVGNPAAFAANQRVWELGRTNLRVDPTAFGDDQQLWTIGDQGYVQQLDVSNPAAITAIASFPRSWAAGLVPLGGLEVVLFQFSTDATLVHLDKTISTVSRTFRITLAARDAAGNVTRSARTVQVIPYDHAPSIDAVQIAQGATTADTWIIRVTATDPDAAAGWDPTQTVRADWDGDGAWDTDWSYVSGGTADIYANFATAGHRDAIIQVRDGFFATATTPLSFDVQ
ncbi:MAG: hypothetical protein K8W52_24435 [Deltaproteobacteria bacterium]|nr:hypothetical protein [Deltaproteobacteria bacterium]